MTGNPELIEQYRQIHATRVYGDTSIKNLRFIRADIRLLEPRSVLDYGCGQSRLIDALDLGYPARLLRYDPAIPEWATKPNEQVDLLINIDVLEHIEESDLDEVMADMAGLCRDALIIVDTRPAAAILPDGRNAHATIRPHAWWRERLSRHFPLLYQQATARRSRAGFRTWARSPGQAVQHALMRAGDTARYYASKLTPKAGGH